MLYASFYKALSDIRCEIQDVHALTVRLTRTEGCMRVERSVKLIVGEKNTQFSISPRYWAMYTQPHKDFPLGGRCQSVTLSVLRKINVRSSISVLGFGLAMYQQMWLAFCIALNSRPPCYLHGSRGHSANVSGGLSQKALFELEEQMDLRSPPWS